MATHSSILAWRIPWTEKPGGLQSARSQSLAGYRKWGHKELDMTEQLTLLMTKMTVIKTFAYDVFDHSQSERK